MRRKKEDSLETKKMLIDSAIEVIYKKGYAKTTISDIVEHINLTRGAFYWYFNNKKEILDEISNRYATNYLNDYTKIEIKESAYETIRGILLHQIKKIYTDKYITLAYIIRYKVEAITELPGLLEKQKYIDYIGIDLIKREITKGIKQGEFNKDIDPLVMAVSIFTSIIGLENFVMLHNGNDELSIDKIETMADYILEPLFKK